jgi:hypothetical protein
MPKVRRGLRTGLCLLVLMLIGTVAADTVFAEEAASGAHGDGKGSVTHGDGEGFAAPAAERADPASSRGHGEEGGAKGEARPSRSDDNKGQKSGGSDRGETAKDLGPSAEPAKGSSSPEPYYAPSRRLDKRNGTPGQANATAHAVKPSLSRRLSRVPQPSNPIRNAIGVPLTPPENAERRDGAQSPPAISHPPAAASIVPGNVTGRVGKSEGVNHPIANPVVTPSTANRGAINGTGVTRHNVGAPRIGGPTASAAGVNGTAIRPKQ